MLCFLRWVGEVLMVVSVPGVVAYLHAQTAAGDMTVEVDTAANVVLHSLGSMLGGIVEEYNQAVDHISSGSPQGGPDSCSATGCGTFDVEVLEFFLSACPRFARYTDELRASRLFDDRLQLEGFEDALVLERRLVEALNNKACSGACGWILRRIRAKADAHLGPHEPIPEWDDQAACTMLDALDATGDDHGAEDRAGPFSDVEQQDEADGVEGADAHSSTSWWLHSEEDEDDEVMLF
mmetsp:Transcript_58503/g.164002  ORF Transcript_58503/g.164002 Transcript_58503/m.164002 type:complete len:237 (-) Transcript_58503:71-781(-)